MKYEVYEEAGVKEYWIADPAKKAVLVFLLQPDGKFAVPDIFSGERPTGSPMRPRIFPKVQHQRNFSLHKPINHGRYQLQQFSRWA
jgi:hypothetical protein